jgi:hypothetical protein
VARRRPLDPPQVPESRLDGWRQIEDTTESVFDSLFVSVTARTLVYEDERLRTAFLEAAGVEFAPRFFFASRIALDPSPPNSRMLDRMVSMRARDGFADRLRERGFGRVEAGRHREYRVDGREGDLYRFDAECRPDGVALSAVGLTAVWPDGDGYLFAGGAYPTQVARGRSELDETDRTALGERIDANAFREELLELIRATG